ncbi:MerR family transcriptional regulator [Chloroflexi bacterium TSY]|nr:MerR family transcriptional regulator [Chloroflexi bacterium TSY]
MCNESVTPPPHTQTEGRLSVGRFAQASLLSRKALRLYNQLGILVPDYVDPDSGYRYYSAAQLETAYYVRLLREMDMPLADVRRVLAAATHDQAIEQIIQHRHDFEAKVERMRRASHHVLAYLRKEQATMSVDISVKQFAACKAISVTKHITVPAFHKWIPQVLEQLNAHIQEDGASTAGDPICFYYGPVNENDNGPVEVCWPVTGEMQPRGEVVVREIPAHRGAISSASKEQSSYPTILDVWSEVVGWVQQNGYTINEETVCCYEIWPSDHTVSVDPNLAFLAIFSRDCRDFGVIYSDFGYRKQPISYLKIAQI